MKTPIRLRHYLILILLCFTIPFLSGCKWFDGDGNTPDTTAPVISLSGANPQTIEIGTAYTELGATATDDKDGV